MQDYTENHPDVEILDPKIIVFHNALSDPDAYIDHYEEYGEWRGWYGFGRQIDSRGHSFKGHPTFPTWGEWEEVLDSHDHESGKDQYRREIAQSFHLATKFYREFTGKDLPNWSCQPWGLARYIPDEDLIGDDQLTMNYHTDYMVEDIESEGSKFGITAVIYPNDDYEGGELSFRVKGEDGVERSFDYKPRAGDLVMFPSGPPYFHAVKRMYGSPKYITRLYWEYEYEGSEDWHRLKAKYGDGLDALEKERRRRPDMRITEPTMRARFTLKEYYDLLESGNLLPDYRDSDAE